MADLPFVSVVVPAFNAQQTIRHTIQSLVSQSYRGDYEIIIVDDGSVDKTPDIIRSFRQVIYVRQPNAGPAAARNRGAGMAKGEIVLFTDSDCAAHIDWIEKIVQGFNSDEIAAVCGSYGIANPQNLLSRCIHDEIVFRHQKLMPSFPKAFGSYNVGIRRAIFWNVGGFDESYRRASGEDNDLSYKILDSGGRIYFVKDALVDHYHTTRLSKYLNEQYRHGFWRAKLYRKHPGMVKGDDYTFWKDILEVPLVGMICLFLFFMLIGNGWSIYLLLLTIFVFWSLEMYFANVVCFDFYSKIYFSFVMFFRAFARVFGLSTGFFDYLLNFFKKNQIKS